MVGKRKCLCNYYKLKLLHEIKQKITIQYISDIFISLLSHLTTNIKLNLENFNFSIEVHSVLLDSKSFSFSLFLAKNLLILSFPPLSCNYREPFLYFLLFYCCTFSSLFLYHHLSVLLHCQLFLYFLMHALLYLQSLSIKRQTNKNKKVKYKHYFIYIKAISISLGHYYYLSLIKISLSQIPILQIFNLVSR